MDKRDTETTYTSRRFLHKNIITLYNLETEICIPHIHAYFRYILLHIKTVTQSLTHSHSSTSVPTVLYSSSYQNRGVLFFFSHIFTGDLRFQTEHPATSCFITQHATAAVLMCQISPPNTNRLTKTYHR